MARAPGIEIEQFFAPEADLGAYESMEKRDLYLGLMKGVFAHQGLPTDERTLAPPFAGMYVTPPGNARTSTDDTIRVGEKGAEREVRVKTSAVGQAYAGIEFPVGPSASVTLSTMKDGEIVELSTSANQEGQDFFLISDLNVRNPLDGKRQQKTTVVDWLWAGNTDGTDEPIFSMERLRKSMLREIRPAKRRALGVSIEALGQLAAVRS